MKIVIVALVALSLVAASPAARADEPAVVPARLHLATHRLEAPAVDTEALAARGSSMLVAGIAMSAAGHVIAIIGAVAWATARPDHESCGASGSSSSGDWGSWIPEGWAWSGGSCTTIHDSSSDAGRVVLMTGILTAGAGLALAITGAATRAEAQRLEHESMTTTPYVMPSGHGFEAGVRIEGIRGL